MQVRALQSREDLERYLDFAQEVYRGNPHWIEPDRHHLLEMIGGTAPQASHCRIQPFWAEAGGRVAATVTAVVDDAFNRHWNQRAGQLLFFEALPDAGKASGALLDTACKWLAERECQFARLSFLYGWQLPHTIDAYDVPPTFAHTYNPAYYHGFIKSAGFFSEKGQAEYRVQFDRALADRYREMVERAERTGVRLRSWDFSQLERETEAFTAIVNQTFAAHWGAPQFTVAEMSGLTIGLKEFLVPEFTAFAEVEGEVAGAVFSLPDLNQAARGEEINQGVLLVIGVDAAHRGKGFNLALAARSYLAMMERGYRSASYTIVLDDNWPSRRTAEKLGAHVARNFMVYRRDLR
ncbi:MAG: GNAT family N-acetyltransferase [Terriglobales bacterium]